MKIYDDYEELTHAVLKVGFFAYAEELADGVATLDEMVDAVDGLTVTVCADLENTDEYDLEFAPVIFGVEIFTSYGGPEQERGFTWEELQAKIDDAMAIVEGAREAVAEFFPDEPEIGVYLGCCGWLASAWCIKGEWDETIDYDKRKDFEGGSFGGRDNVYLYQGTDGSSQEPYPNGGVKGIWVAGDSFDGNACATLELSDERDKELDETLAAAGVEEPRYYFIARYD